MTTPPGSTVPKDDETPRCQECGRNAPDEIMLMHDLPDTTQLCIVNNVGSKTCVDVGELRAWLVRR